MSVSVVAASCCAVQIGYLETQNQPNALGAELGLIKALKSPSNKAGFIGQSLMGEGMPVAGSGCKLQLKYVAPDCVASTDVNTLCDDATGNTASPFKTTEFVFVKADDNRGKIMNFSEDQFRCACEKKDQVVVATTDAKIKRILIDEEQRLLTSTFACLGNYCDDTVSNVAATVKTANIFNVDGNFAQAAGWDLVNEQMSSMGFTGKPIVIGGSALRKYMFIKEYGGLGANAVGFEKRFTDSSPFEFYYSTEFDKTISPLVAGGGDFAIVLAPGSIQMLEFLQNIGSFQRKTDTMVRTTIDKVVGNDSHKFDYQTYYDERCATWKILVNRMSATWCMPADDYCADVNGNGRFLIRLGCGEVNCVNSCTPAVG